MQTGEHDPPGSVRVDQQRLWRFRAIPEEVQRCSVRRLALCGLPDHEIAARTGWSIQRVREEIRAASYE
jgi:hypothetical protein